MNKLLFIANVAFLLYQFQRYNAWLKDQTKAIDAIKLPECPTPETIVPVIPTKRDFPVEPPQGALPKWTKWDFNWDG